MLKVKSGDIEKEFIVFIEVWFDLLAQGKMKEACQKIDKPNCYGILFTPEKILEIVNDS